MIITRYPETDKCGSVPLASIQVPDLWPLYQDLRLNGREREADAVREAIFLLRDFVWNLKKIDREAAVTAGFIEAAQRELHSFLVGPRRAA